ncbi:MAG: formate dehydrogenase, partial [Rhodobacteraceae bacterium]|nr:formate dehydrogenase [Paracoccaceae bacterium]
MTTRVYIPRDSAAKAVGADDVAHAMEVEAEKSGTKIEIVRTGSRGMFWLEPLVEVETAKGRIAYGPLSTADLPELIAGGMLNGANHKLCIGKPEDHPFMKGQTRLVFARCGITDPLSLADYRKHGGLHGLDRARKLDGAAVVEEVIASGLRGRGGAGFPTGIKW